MLLTSVPARPWTIGRVDARGYSPAVDGSQVRDVPLGRVEANDADAMPLKKEERESTLNFLSFFVVTSCRIQI